LSPCPTRRSSDLATVGITICASGSVNRNPTRCRILAACRRVSCPSTVTEPEVGSASPLNSRASVLFPDPFAPTTPIRRSASVALTPRNTSRSPNRTRTSSSSITPTTPTGRTCQRVGSFPPPESDGYVSFHHLNRTRTPLRPPRTGQRPPARHPPPPWPARASCAAPPPAPAG